MARISACYERSFHSVSKPRHRQADFAFGLADFSAERSGNLPVFASVLVKVGGEVAEKLVIEVFP